MLPELFKDHILFQKLDQLQASFSSEEAKSKIDIDRLNFFKTVHLYIQDRINITIPIIIQEAELNALSNECEAAMVQINNFIGNNNPGHITNAEANLYSAINRVRMLPLPLSKGDFSFSKVISNFEETIKTKYNELKKENILIKEDLNKYGTELEKRNADLTNILNKITQITNEISSITTNFTNEFNTIKTIESKNYQSERETYRKEFDKEKENISPLFNREVQIIRQKML
jgi:hypothetical protein